MNSKKIGILGSGVVGKTLAAGFIKHGYQVTIGTREATKLAEWNKQVPAAHIDSFENTAKFGDIIVLACKGYAAQDVLKLAGHANLKGKIIIDATNPIDEKVPPVNGVLNFYTDLHNSQMEQLQKAAPDANFVKAFSCVGSAFMVDPKFESKPTMFICGNNDSAKKEVTTILDQFGWETEDMGKAEGARAIEPLCILWCIPGMLSNRWSHAFKLLKK